MWNVTRQTKKRENVANFFFNLNRPNSDDCLMRKGKIFFSTISNSKLPSSFFQTETASLPRLILDSFLPVCICPINNRLICRQLLLLLLEHYLLVICNFTTFPSIFFLISFQCFQAFSTMLLLLLLLLILAFLFFSLGFFSFSFLFSWSPNAFTLIFCSFPFPVFEL